MARRRRRWFTARNILKFFGFSSPAMFVAALLSWLGFQKPAAPTPQPPQNSNPPLAAKAEKAKDWIKAFEKAVVNRAQSGAPPTTPAGPQMPPGRTPPTPDRTVNPKGPEGRPVIAAKPNAGLLTPPRPPAAATKGKERDRKKDWDQFPNFSPFMR